MGRDEFKKRVGGKEEERGGMVVLMYHGPAIKRGRKGGAR
jgi:hypothetical protein